MTGSIFNIQPFSVNDGPGGRTIIFRKGCNLSCEWCHNPESQRFGVDIQYFKSKCIGCGECAKVCPFTSEGKTALFTDRCDLCGKCVDVCYPEALKRTGFQMGAEELFSKIKKDKDFFFSSGGGVTFSGGEPLLQADYVAEVMLLCKNEGIHTAVESAVCIDRKNIDKLLPVCDLFICDLKSADSVKHRAATGAGNERIIENLHYIAKEQKPLLIRTPVIPCFNASDEEIMALCSIVSELKKEDTAFAGYELLPFHSICASKYDSLNIEFKSRLLPEPGEEEMHKYRKITEDFGL